VGARPRGAGLDRIVIATDDERIADAARGFGAEVEMTPADCPSGTDRVAQGRVAPSRGRNRAESPG
jgi:3-deoxy-manno-octulosonate cytidylyltransferase (CMP-KDO synthetase)